MRTCVKQRKARLCAFSIAQARNSGYYGGYMTQEIERLSQRLRLSQGDLLGLAREVAQNANLRSIDNLSEMQHATLVQYLTLLARPAEPRSLLHFAA